MKDNILLKSLLIGVVLSAGALAEMTVDKSNGVLTVTSTIRGTVIAKVIGADDKVVLNSKEEGNSFTWSPSGVDGAYRYDVRVIPATQKSESTSSDTQATNMESTAKSDYAGGSVEVVDGQMLVDEEIPTIENEEE